MAQQPARILTPFSMDLAMNYDLLIEILLRLPAKSLTRFKSVCKEWLSIISSDHFCHHHTLHRPKLQPSLILHVPSFDELFYFNQTINGEKILTPYTKSSSLDPDHGHEIVQACNGLLLLVSEYYVDDPTTFNENRDLITIYYVYNPTTKKSREISLTHNHDYPRVVAIGLAFDPLLSPYYKIVCIRSNSDSAHCNYTFQIEVYDSESQNWKMSVEAFTHSNTIHSSSISFEAAGGVYWNNSIYWKSDMNRGGYFCFDIAKNEMKPLPFPQTPDLTSSGTKKLITYAYLQESNGHLYHFIRVCESLNERGVFGPYESAESVAVWELGWNNEHHSHDQWLFKYHHTLGDGKRHSRNFIRLMVGSDGDGDGDGDGDETCSLLTYSLAGRMKAYSFLNKTYEELFHFKTHTDFVLGFLFGEVLALV